MKKIIFTLVTLSLFCLISCKSTIELTNDLSAAQIIQMGQNAYDSSDFSNAEYCYQTAIKRYGMNIEVYLEANYELGHTYLAEHKYSEAYAVFKEILDLYEQTPSGDLPSAYKKLAQIGMEQIPEGKDFTSKVAEKAATKRLEEEE